MNPAHGRRGLFTTAGCENGRPLLWDRHLRRLEASFATLGLGSPPALPREVDVAARLHREGLTGTARFRLAVVEAGSGWIVQGTGQPVDACGPDLDPVDLVSLAWRRLPAGLGHKVLDRGAWDLARAEARADGGDDALIVDSQDLVLETSIANVFAVFGETVVTPPAPGRCLPGVMRAWLLGAFPRLGLAVEERDIPLGELLDAGEVWVSNAVVGVRRVAAVGTRRWSGWPVFSRLAAVGIPAPGWPPPARP